MARKLCISTDAVWRYKLYFDKLKAEDPIKLQDKQIYPKRPPHTQKPSARLIHFQEVIDRFHNAFPVGTERSVIWRSYYKEFPNGFKYLRFIFFYNKYLEEKGITHILLDKIEEADIPKLTKWRNSNDHRLWQISMVLKFATEGFGAFEIKNKVYCNFPSVAKWINIYKTKGLDGFKIPHYYWPAKRDKINIIKGKLTKLIGELPKAHGINRTSWTGTHLWIAYNNLYPDTPCSVGQIRTYMKQMGYKRRISKQMLTSQDPDYRAKLDKIHAILRKLKTKEKFFSIDEYGPVGIKIKGGKTWRHKSDSPAAVPQMQTIKGCVICTAALELSTNQITYFFSSHKNTFEMIKLVDVLREKYADQSKLYLSWDGASWHSSKLLKKHVEAVNKTGKPKIFFAPLPNTTQWMNVIEAVFGGLARAVIHNSDYKSVDECKTAIDLYFKDRNEHFRLNPKKAGDRIWGLETTKAVFSEAHVTRHSSHMRGYNGKD
ncbi:IS630 family transposase [Mucilaginibacter sp. 21P]|uniref:IS630 family transposase n=1 Tax=Mucilaginibacter sp. 21P TaxID=2778902 RepID=UPI001C579996|nr:IS630 family transposase [Mucilaginibacter sp. 21P]